MISKQEEKFLLAGATALVFLVIFGLTMNTIAIFAIRSLEKKCKLFNNILISLLVFDSWFLLTAPLFYFGVNHEYFGCQLCTQAIPYWSFPCGHMALFGTILMTLAIAHERYLAVKDPLYYMRAGGQSPKTRLMIYVIPATILSVAFNIPRFFIFNLVMKNAPTTTAYDNDTTTTAATTTAMIYSVELSKLGNSGSYLFYYTYLANTGLFGIIPFCLIVFFNFLTYSMMREQNQICQQSVSHDKKGSWMPTNKRKLSNLTPKNPKNFERQETFASELERREEEKNVSRVMKVIAVVFLGCHSMRVVLNVYDGLTGSRGNRGIDFFKVGIEDAYSTAVHTGVFLEMVNSSIGPVLYCYMSVTFRRHFILTTKRLVFRLFQGKIFSEASPESSRIRSTSATPAKLSANRTISN